MRMENRPRHQPVSSPLRSINQSISVDAINNAVSSRSFSLGAFTGTRRTTKTDLLSVDWPRLDRQAAVTRRPPGLWSVKQPQQLTGQWSFSHWPLALQHEPRSFALLIDLSHDDELRQWRSWIAAIRYDAIRNEHSKTVYRDSFICRRKIIKHHRKTLLEQ